LSGVGAGWRGRRFRSPLFNENPAGHVEGERAMNRSYPYLILGFVAWFLGASPTPAVGDVQYTITDLGPWRAYAINDAGQVVGEGPRIWDQGITSTIGSSSGTAYDIN